MPQYAIPALLCVLLSMCSLQSLGYAPGTLPSNDTTIVLCLTEEEVRIFNEMGDATDECYAHFVDAVRLVRVWRGLHDELCVKNKRLEKILTRYQLDELEYETALELSAEDMSRMQKDLNKMLKKVKRRNTWLYLLGGVTLAETLTLALTLGLVK